MKFETKVLRSLVYLVRIGYPLVATSLSIHYETAFLRLFDATSWVFLEVIAEVQQLSCGFFKSMLNGNGAQFESREHGILQRSIFCHDVMLV